VSSNVAPYLDLQNILLKSSKFLQNLLEERNKNYTKSLTIFLGTGVKTKAENVKLWFKKEWISFRVWGQPSN
jgi:hypothetical protein